MIRATAISIACVTYLWLASFGNDAELAFLWPSIIGFAVAVLIGAVAKAGARPAAISTLCAAVVGAFVAYVSWRCLSSDVVYLGREHLAICLTVFLIYALFATFGGSSRVRLFFVSLLFVLLVGNVATAFYQHFVDAEFSIIPGYRRDIAGHFPAGFFNVHPHFAGFIEAVTPFALALFLLGRIPAAARIACLGVCVVGCGGLVLAMSRGGFLGGLAATLTVGGAFVFLISRVSSGRLARFRPLLIAGLVVGMLGFVAVGYVTLNKRFGGAPVDEDGKVASRGRAAYWEAAWDQFGDAPVTGTGSRSFTYHFNKNYPDGFWVGSPTPQYAHNDYLQVLAEYGIIGAILIILLILVHLGRGLRFVRWLRDVHLAGEGRATSNRAALAVGALGSLAALLVHSCFDFNMQLLPNAAVIGFALAILAAPGTRARMPSAGIALSRVVGPLVAVCLLFFAVKYAPADEALRRGERAHRAGDLPGAIAAMHRVTEIDPANFRAHRNLGLYRFDNIYDDELPTPVVIGYVEQALESFETTLDHHPFEFYSMVYAGRCEAFLAVYERREAARDKRFAQAEDWLAKAAFWAPKRHEPATWQGDLLSTRASVAEINGDLPLALQLSKQAFERFDYALSRTAMRLRGNLPQEIGRREMKKAIAQLELEIGKGER